ncbi:MAG: hypothetical protein HC838_17195 [Spirulinaceae cyanobacterium RM2_2_10]|nr:hypothetical protein [Spirulinaceae cyanobacterium RM2_2_10]
MTSVEPTASLMQDIAFGLSGNSAATQSSHVFTPDELRYLRNVRFFDSADIVHPRHYDRIVNVQKRQVERIYLNFTGNVHTSKTLQLSEKEFWEPVELLSKYYVRLGKFPYNTNLSVVYMVGILANAR